MRARIIVLGAWIALATTMARAHGPQIQITNDADKVITRQLISDAPYSSTLTSPTKVYVMPLMPFGGVWYARPNNEVDPILSQPTFFSGPGLAYGYDQVDDGPQAFVEGSVLSVGFTDGLKHWTGAIFADAGDTQAKAFRGSNVDIADPPESVGVTTDNSPFDSVSLEPVLANYGSAGTEVHGTIRFALLGDGTSPTSASLDGVYLLSLQLASSQAGLAPSDEYFFVLHKNVLAETVAAAVESLGVAPSLVQFVPEPNSSFFIAASWLSLLLSRRMHRRFARD